MTNTSYVQKGGVELIHHSTSSLVEIRVTDEENVKQSIWLDYFDFDNLTSAMESFLGQSINPEL